MHGPMRPMTSADLAAVPAFAAGAVAVVPARRAMSGPGGEVTTEPRVMQVLVALAEAGGQVLTRPVLVARCWGGVFVADESVNRAISALRRALALVGAVDAIETLPRIGYRLRLPVIWEEPAGDDAAGFEDAIAAGRRALRAELPDPAAQGVADLRRAVALRPGDAVAWGLLACALRNVAEHSPPAGVRDAADAAEVAARRALALDPNEGHALAALATLQPDFGDWLAAEARLRAVLQVAPDSIPALAHLERLLQSVGRTRDSLAFNARAMQLDPLSPMFQARQAMKCWMLGDVPAADRAIERARLLWPRHPLVWSARMMLLAFTGRAHAGLVMLDRGDSCPIGIPANARLVWEVALPALETRSEADIAVAQKRLPEMAAMAFPLAVVAMMTLSVLGDLDRAFAIARASLLGAGPDARPLFPGSARVPMTDLRWRRTMPLFNPALRAMRADPRFDALCDAIGLSDYWRARGVEPDYRPAELRP